MDDAQTGDRSMPAAEGGLHPVLVSLLQIELANRPLRECLKNALQIVISAPFAALLPAGGIFLADRKTRELELVVHENFAEPLLELCAHVPYGHCLCGRAAEERRIIHADHVDERHDTRFEGIRPHGHYNVPILSGARLLGVMVLYLTPGHQRLEEEVRFLEAAALVLAGIIERKRFEEQQESHYQSLIENLPQRIFYKDPDLRYVSCNRRYARDLGIQVGDICGRTDQEFYTAEQAEKFAAEDRQVMETGQGIEKDVIRNYRGFESSYHLLKMPLRGPAGLIMGVFGMYWDNAEEKRSREALKESEEKFSAMANSAQDAIVMVDQQEQVIFWNTASEVMFGFQVADVVGQRLDDWIEPGESRDQFARLVAELTTAGRERSSGRTVELVARRKGGERFPIELSISALLLRGEWHAIGIIRDISERKQTEQERQLMEVQLRQAQKLESIGQLAAGISHEINTPTQFVGDNIRFLKESLADLDSLVKDYQQLARRVESDTGYSALVQQIRTKEQAIDLDFLSDEIPRAVDQSIEGVERISKIVRAMKEFSHPGEVDKVEVDINRAIRTTMEVSRNEWKYVATVELQLDENLPRVLCVPDQINQVFLNLIVNAAHAIADTQVEGNRAIGTIRIISRLLDGAVEIQVIDSGTGIPEAIKGRIFDPFFTTKSVGKGTGQGLCIAYSTVVDQHGGTLGVEDNPEGGATFIVRLPLAPEADSLEQDGPS